MKKIVVSIFPENRQAKAIDAYLEFLNPSWDHIPIYGSTAEAILNNAVNLHDQLNKNTYEVKIGDDFPERIDFSHQVANLNHEFGNAGRYLIVSPTLTLFDLVSDATGFWGDRSIYSHLLLYDDRQILPSLERVLFASHSPIGSYLLLCPMAMDRAVPRHMQDIVTVASSLEHKMPVEIWLQPTFDRALQALERTDLSWLHIDTHGYGNGEALMLGPSRDQEDLIGAEHLPSSVTIPLMIVVGCAASATAHSIGSALFNRGVQTVWGPCIIFQSTGVANSETGEALWYQTFLTSLLEGRDVGESLLGARRNIQGGLLKYATVLLGSSMLRFT